MQRISIIDSHCLIAGHRAFLLRGESIHIEQTIRAGWGRRNMETGAPVSARLEANLWLHGGSLASQESFRFRPQLDWDDGSGDDHARAGRVRIAVGEGNEGWGEDGRTLWAGRAGFIAHARCVNGRSPLSACPAPFSDLQPEQVLSTQPAFDPIHRPPSLPVRDLYQSRIVRGEIGPRYLLRCDGTVASRQNLRPFHRSVLGHVQRRTSPAGDRFPTSMSEWWADYPDIPRGGEVCPDSDQDGLWDELEQRVGGCDTCVTLMDDRDGDGIPLYLEAYVFKSDPLVPDRAVP